MPTKTQDLDTALCVLTRLIAEQLPDSNQFRSSLVIAAEELHGDNPSAAVLLCRLASMIHEREGLTPKHGVYLRMWEKVLALEVHRDLTNQVIQVLIATHPHAQTVAANVRAELERCKALALPVAIENAYVDAIEQIGRQFLPSQRVVATYGQSYEQSPPQYPSPPLQEEED